MANQSTSTQDEEKGLTYPELVSKLQELGLDVTITKDDYSRATKGVKKLIKALLDRIEEAEAGAGPGAGFQLTREDIEYIIYRLRTIYGDARATSIVAKLSDALRKMGA